MRNEILIYPILFILLVGSFAGLYVKIKFTKSNELEDLQKVKKAVEKPWFMPLFLFLWVLASASITQDVLVFLLGSSLKSLSLYTLDNLSLYTLYKYIFAIWLAVLTFIFGIIGRRRPKS